MQINIERLLNDGETHTFELTDPNDLAFELIGWEIETSVFSEEDDELLITVSDQTDSK